MAPQTWRTYKNAEIHFSNFRKELKLKDIWPVPHEHLINYIAFLSVNGSSASTVSTYVSAISYFHKIRNLSDPTKLFIIGKLIEGMKRKNKKVDVKSPITYDLLCKLVSALPHTCSSYYEAIIFQGAFLLAFYVFLRVSEFTATSKFDTSGKALKINDILLSRDNKLITLCIRESKTDQRGQTSKLSISSSYNDSPNLVSILSPYLSVRPTHCNSQLFIHYNGSPLTRYQFCCILKKSLKFCNIHTGCYRSHSVYIGAAPESANRNIPSDKIKLWGWWKTEAAFNRYTGIPDIIC